MPTCVKLYGVYSRFCLLSRAKRFKAVYNLLEAARPVLFGKNTPGALVPKESLCNTDILMTKPGNM